MSDRQGRASEAAAAITARAPTRPRVAIILGSGLGTVADALGDAQAIEYDAIPHFAATHVDGHAGQLKLGDLAGVSAAVFAGRAHLYEGYGPADVALPIYVARELGAETLIVTNAAGAVNEAYAAGDIMLITDHINLSGQNPLGGAAFEPPSGFVDMQGAYDADLRATARLVASARHVPLHEGVYAMMPGPSYETAAEVRMLRVLGADAVGMSTAMEAIAARRAGMRVLGFSIIANAAAGASSGAPISHGAVLEAVRAAAPRLRAVIEGVVETLRPG